MCHEPGGIEMNKQLLSLCGIRFMRNYTNPTPTQAALATAHNSHRKANAE